MEIGEFWQASGDLKHEIVEIIDIQIFTDPNTGLPFQGLFLEFCDQRRFPLNHQFACKEKDFLDLFKRLSKNGECPELVALLANSEEN